MILLHSLKEDFMNLLKKLSSSIEKQKIVIEHKQDELKQEKQKLNNLLQQTIEINLGELKNELQSMFDKDYNIMIEYKIQGTSGRVASNIKTIEQFVKEVGYNGYFLKSRILISYTHPNTDPYYHYIYFKDFANPDMEALQADGKTLAEHCSLVSYMQNFNWEEEKELSVDKDIDKVNINITYADLIDKTVESQTGTKLFKSAIFNILERRNNQQNEYLNK